MSKSLLFTGGDATSAGELIQFLLGAAAQAHILHLSTRSYAQHMALGALYEGLPGLVDAVAEEYQGCYGTLTFGTCPAMPGGEATAFVQGVYDKLQAQRYALGTDSHIQNSVDEICSLLSSTLYKLKFLA